MFEEKLYKTIRKGSPCYSFVNPCSFFFFLIYTIISIAQIAPSYSSYSAMVKLISAASFAFFKFYFPALLKWNVGQELIA